VYVNGLTNGWGEGETNPPPKGKSKSGLNRNRTWKKKETPEVIILQRTAGCLVSKQRTSQGHGRISGKKLRRRRVDEMEEAKKKRRRIPVASPGRKITWYRQKKRWRGKKKRRLGRKSTDI